MTPARLRVLFVVVALALIVLGALAGIEDDEPVLENLGKSMGFVALVLLLLQYSLSARIPLLDRAFGLDRLLLAHRVLGAAAVVLATLHPMLLFGGSDESIGPLRAELWPELLGVAALIVVWVVVCTAVWRVFLRLPYEAWRRVHLLAFVAATVAAAHALCVDDEVREGARLVFLILLLGGYFALGVWVRAFRRGRAFEVKAVTALNHNVNQIELAPAAGEPLAYLPGQFAFLRLRSEGIAREEHPFTLSSSPSRPDGIAFSIKASGDYTGTLAEVSVGARADVMGPFGRFSHVLCGEGDLLLVAGGIGVTPMISMIRHLADTEPDRAVTLLWGNRTEADIVFREELDQLAERMPSLRVVHVLSRQEDWTGETGRIDAALLKRVLSERERAAHVFLCGPTPMMRDVRRALRQAGVPRARLHAEVFAL